MKNKTTTIMNVKQNEIRVIRIDDEDYISLTDIARYKNPDDPSDIIKKWMSNYDTIEFLGLWEELSNVDFNSAEFRRIKMEAPKKSFTMTPSQWCNKVNAKGIKYSKGKYSVGTFAHPDIAFEFASWLSPEFKLYLIKEFERLKAEESYRNNIEWNATRLLSKVNYVVHTDAVKEFIVPTLTDKQLKFIYAEEADVLNVALFGMTAKEWREQNPELAKKGNIRDYTDLLHLVILNNLQNTNAELIENNIPQNERLIKLNNSARRQMKVLQNNKNIEELKLLQEQVNDEKYLLEESKN